MWFCVIITTLVRKTASSATIRFSRLKGGGSKARRVKFSPIQAANQIAWSAMKVVLPAIRATASVSRSMGVRSSCAFRSSSAIAWML
jgi:hypothetical protein